MKERIILFSDAVIAIILTVMVVNIPVQHMNNSIDLITLLQIISIYFISFCFVASLWFQTAKAFEKVEKVRNRDLIIYLVLLFFLSLVPKATELIIEEATQQVVLIYGILTFIVTFLMYQLLLALIRQRKKDDDFQFSAKRRKMYFEISIRLGLLVAAWFFPSIALIVYCAVPIVQFLQNVTDEEEENFVDQLDEDQREFYRSDNKNIWKNSFNRFGTLLSSSLSSNDNSKDEFSPQWRSQFAQDWASNLENRLNVIQNQIDKSTDPGEIERLQKRKADLAHQTEKIKSEIERRTSHQNSRYTRDYNTYTRDLEKIALAINSIQERLTQPLDSREEKQLTRELAKLTRDQEKLNLEWTARKKRLGDRRQGDSNDIAKKIDRL